MGYNKKVLSTAIRQLDKAKAPAKSRDIITDPMGQWKYPGQPTRIPGNDITMQGVDYPVYGIDNTGFAQMMYPGQDYQFQGEYVDEYPLEQARKGGERRYSRSLTARNKLFTPNVLTKKKKKKIFDPNAKYYQDGGSSSISEIDNIALQKAIRQTASKNSVGIKGIPDTNITSFNQIYPEIVNAVKERYDELIKESLALKQDGGDISIPKLTEAQEGGTQKTAEDWPRVEWNDGLRDQYLQEATSYANPTQKKLQGNLIEKLQQAKRAYNRHRENSGLDQRKQSIEGDSSIASLKEQIASYKKELDVEKKSFQRAQTALNVLKTKDPDNWKDAKLNDVMSAKGVDALRTLYSDGKISEGTHRDFYNNFGQFYDRETTRTTADDQEALEESWLGKKDKQGRRKWMSDPKNVAKVAHAVAVNAALGPAAGMVTPGLTAAANIGTRAFGTVGRALNYAPIKALPGLTTNTAARAYWLGNTLINDVPETVALTKEFLLADSKDPDYLDKRNDALLSAAFTAAGLAGGKGGFDLLKGSKIGIPAVVNGKIIDPIKGAIGKARDASGRFSEALEATLQNPLSNILPATGVIGRLTQRPGVKQVLDATNSGNIISSYYVGKNLDNVISGDKYKLIEEALADGDYTRAALLSGSTAASLSPFFGKTGRKFFNNQQSFSIRAANDFNESLIKTLDNKEVEGDEEFKLGLTTLRLLPGLMARTSKQKGGVANDSYVDTLSDKQIKDLIQKGYKIEYLD